MGIHTSHDNGHEEKEEIDRLCMNDYVHMCNEQMIKE